MPVPAIASGEVLVRIVQVGIDGTDMEINRDNMVSLYLVRVILSWVTKHLVK